MGPLVFVNVVSVDRTDSLHHRQKNNEGTIAMKNMYV